MKTTVRIYSSDQIVKRKEMDDLKDMHKKEFEEIKAMLSEMKVKRTSDPKFLDKVKGWFKKPVEVEPLKVNVSDGIGAKDKLGG